MIGGILPSGFQYVSHTRQWTDDPTAIGFVNGQYVKEGNIQKIIDEDASNYKVNQDIRLTFFHKS